ncbi:MAG: leucine--tRNA ligase [Methanobacteriota archaeon]|nr:MAG: leucine--tRNA ligase [Euryarchaeota archaeon]
MALDFPQIEAKWQDAWYSARVNESEPEQGKPKFFMIFAYPGVTGYLHVGHMRGYTVSDAIVRYKLMTGYNVLFPVGTHATGNGAISFARRVERRDPATVDILTSNGCSEETLSRLEDPLEVVRFFNGIYLNDYWKRFGFFSDWRRFTSTINPDYMRFIEWQMLKLRAEGLLIQKPYYAAACVEHGPVAIDASETDISKGGSAEVLEYSLLKFELEDGRKLAAATLRPETVFGLTNFWVNPEVEYVDARVGDETWVVSRQAAEKLALQMDDVEVVDSADGGSLIGKSCKAPYTEKTIRIFPSALCDPDVGTGLVMSVPSDAPVDWVGLVELRGDSLVRKEYGITDAMLNEAAPVAIIDTPGYGPLPAVEVTERMGISSLDDPRLDEATREVYKTGFHKGVMNSSSGDFAGWHVERAKDAVREQMIESGAAAMFYDLSEEVLCRCGNKVLVKKIPDQWFIDYGNAALKESSKEHALTMKILPKEYHDNIQNVLEWYRERACVRLGNWLGTPFPLDDRWIVEAIADSTLYPIYYVLAKYANEGLMRPEEMNEPFFDYVLLGRGDVQTVACATGIDTKVLSAARAEFEYWYPLDINLGGKEHMTVHFPVFLMNHVGILRQEHWPMGIIVNWYITATGGKISKSKGGAQPIPDAAERFGVDAMRLFYAHIASLYVDVAWEDEKVQSYRDRIERIWNFVVDSIEMNDGPASDVDAWLRARVESWIAEAHAYMEQYDLRSYANNVYFEISQDFKWYLRRGGASKEVVGEALRTWTQLMAPITPHLAEEIWERLGMPRFVSNSQLRSARRTESTELEEAKERLLSSLITDISEILRVTSIKPSKVVLMTAPRWKNDVLDNALSGGEEGADVGRLVKEAMPSLPQDARKELPAFAKAVASEVGRMSPDERRRASARVDELTVLRVAKEFLEDYFRCEVLVFSADDTAKLDPENRARQARPGRPAIHVE